MFEQERQAVEEKIILYLQENNFPTLEELAWRNIHFTGEWGIATSFFQVAAGEARSGKKVNVALRAQELAEAAKGHIGLQNHDPASKVRFRNIRVIEIQRR